MPLDTAYIFDFDTEVARARRDYPAETKDCTFIDMSCPNAEQQVRDWIVYQSGLVEDYFRYQLSYGTAESFERWCGSPPPDMRNFDVDAALKIEYFTPYLRAKIDDEVNNVLRNQNLCVAAYAGDNKLLAMNAQFPLALVDGAQKKLFFAFTHELGHIVVPHALKRLDEVSIYSRPAHVQNKVKLWENKADCFALLRGVHLGVLSVSDRETLAVNRLLCAFLSNDLAHFTTAALMSLDIDSAGISRLHPRQIKKIAADHGSKFTSSGKQRNDDTAFARAFFGKAQAKNKSALLALYSAIATAGNKSLAACVLGDTSLTARIQSHFNSKKHRPIGAFGDGSSAKALKNLQTMAAAP